VVGQLAAEPLLVRVQDAAQEEFGAGVDDFDDHGRILAEARSRADGKVQSLSRNDSIETTDEHRCTQMGRKE